MDISGARLSPFGEIFGCRQSLTVIITPPTTNEMALATAAPTTPRPAPGMVKDTPRSVIVRVS